MTPERDSGEIEGVLLRQLPIPPSNRRILRQRQQVVVPLDRAASRIHQECTSIWGEIESANGKLDIEVRLDGGLDARSAILVDIAKAVAE